MLAFDDLSVRIGGRLILENASAQIPTGARVGLVGRNGAGKTTLFRVIAGEHAPEHGSVQTPARTRIGRLLQEAPAGPDRLIDIVLAADRERAILLAEAETAVDPHRIAEIQTRLADIGAYAAPARAARILAGLGFSPRDQIRAAAEFSGGWRMRVALAALLFSEPDVLLLDEPTNYLDLEGALWLEDHVARYPRTVVIISHDRDLLDTAVNAILHLDQGKLTFFRGGYSSFERQRRERQTLDLKLAKAQDVERKRLTAFVERFRAKASKARQAQSRLKLLAKLEPIAARVADEVREIVIPQPDKPLSPPIIALDNVAVGYAEHEPVLRRLTLRVDTDDRIALLGANGNGKSTLTKLIAGRLAPMQGTLVRADRLKIAYFAQHQLDELDPAASPYLHVRRLMPEAPEARVRARAGAMGFPGAMADTPVANLSGGEKARLLLGLATFDGPHLLMLDEPTNHLDIDSRAALIEAINEFSGAIVMVSHDRYLLEACADRLWLVADGGVTTFDGDLEDYRRLILKERGETEERTGDQSAAGSPRAARADQRRAAAEKRAELAPLRRRIASLDADIARLTARIAEIDLALADPLLYQRDPARSATLARERAESANALSLAEEQWLIASGEYETAHST